jgi:3-mercaptopyruvate sulfurtransferase SseA
MASMRILLLVAALSAFGCAKTNHEGPKTEQEAHPFKELTVEEVEQKLASSPKPVVIDANPREVYDKNHVPGAIWMSFDEVSEDKLPKDKATPLIFYCANTH